MARGVRQREPASAVPEITTHCPTLFAKWIFSALPSCVNGPKIGKLGWTRPYSSAVLVVSSNRPRRGTAHGKRRAFRAEQEITSGCQAERPVAAPATDGQLDQLVLSGPDLSLPGRHHWRGH